MAVKPTPRVQFRLRITSGDDIAVGPGKVDLLEAIASTGSITAAARQLGMSYRRAWLLVDTMNRCFEERQARRRDAAHRDRPAGDCALPAHRTARRKGIRERAPKPGEIAAALICSPR